MELNQREEILQRLRSAAGHLNAVIEMVAAGAPCEQVLRQSGAVNAGIRMLVCQARRSEAIIVESPRLEERQAELKRLCDLYSILIRYSNQTVESISWQKHNSLFLCRFPA
ncbi:MAG: metal-sensing transcriptional repressor [Chloroflexi bacterium]|nr:metal-sensing transcriptional repressor [Chloroflexota bacterium]